MRNYEEGADPFVPHRKAHRMNSSPFRFTVSKDDLAKHPGSEEIFRGRLSLREIPGAAFREYSSLRDVVCSDVHGELPFGLYTVPAGTIVGDAAILFTSSKRLISEQNAGLLNSDELVEQISAACRIPETPGREHPELLSLVSTCTDCFWHWIMDSLPKVFIAEECGYRGAYLIPYRNAPPSVRESLELLGIAANRIVPHDSSKYVSQTLYIPTYFSGFNLQHNPHFIREYRAWLFSRISRPPAQPERRIYVARKTTARARRISNHEDVARLTERHGYETVFFEDLSLKDQLTLASQSVSMIAPHGSGMTHILFMRDNSSIVELFPYKRSGSVDCYERLAATLSHSYASIESCCDRGTDIQVDIVALQQILEKPGRRPR